MEKVCIYRLAQEDVLISEILSGAGRVLAVHSEPVDAVTLSPGKHRNDIKEGELQQRRRKAAQSP